MVRPRALALVPTALLALAVASCTGEDQPACSTGLVPCGGACVDIRIDEANCGGCGTTCLAGETCDYGLCCADGLEHCGDVCVDPATYAADAANCGGCGVACGTGTCVDGICQCEGATRCDGQTPVCRDVESDELNCLGCGNVCPSGATCTPAGCDCAPLLECGAACVDPQTDEANCGGCVADGQGEVCAAGATCTAGACDCAPLLECGAACVDPETDEANCGSCGNVCATDETCASGVCTCPETEPLTCGTACCAGNGCCSGDTCQTVHSNGLGQSYYDCNPLGTYTDTAAAAAASAWDSAATLVPGNVIPGCPPSGCNGWSGAKGCATWCWDGAYAGHVLENDFGMNCVCATQLSPTWN
jgi:hypothetical protein